MRKKKYCRQNKNLIIFISCIKNWATKPKLSPYLHQTYQADSLLSQKLQGVHCCPHLLPALPIQEALQFWLVLSCKDKGKHLTRKHNERMLL